MRYDVTIFGINLTLNPVAFTLPIGDGWPIYWYGIIIALGFTLAIIYGMKNAERLGINTDKMLDVVIVTTPVAIVCARLYYILFDPERPDNVKFFSSDGLSGIGIYGAVIGAFTCGAIMCKIKKIKILDMFDLAALGFLIGQGIGRWGNFINQEAFGSPTGSSWFGMTSQNVRADFLEKGFDPEALAHPCFLYESIWCIAGFFILNRISKNRKFSGQITLLYCIWYGFERAIVENLRTDSLTLFGPIRVSVVVSAVIFLGALATLIVIHKKHKSAIADTTYIEMFRDEYEDLVDTEDLKETEIKETDTQKEPENE